MSLSRQLLLSGLLEYNVMFAVEIIVKFRVKWMMRGGCFKVWLLLSVQFSQSDHVLYTVCGNTVVLHKKRYSHNNIKVVSTLSPGLGNVSAVDYSTL